MEDKPDEQKPAGLNRRRFIGALGAAAAAGAFLERGGVGANAAPTTVQYLDSFGNLQPVSPQLLSMGIYPPPISNTPTGQSPGPETCAEPTSGTYYQCSFPMYNILLIMVDQMRAPTFWLPSGGQSAIDAWIPNIAGLRNQSWIFPNYSVAATICGPSRACLLTGLYSQQTCFFRSQTTGTYPAPTLLNYHSNWTQNGSVTPGFPTIGNVLSQSLPIGNGLGTQASAAYNCAWIGKWHVSCASGVQDNLIGENGPADYGFTSQYNIPNTSSSYPRGGSGYPSPDGQPNEGNGGDFLDSYAQSPPALDVPTWAATMGTELVPDQVQLNDAAIADAFQAWLANAATAYPTLPAHPWFCAVSFVNPHDISDFPYPFGFTTSGTPVYNPTDFSAPTTPAANGYQPPPQAGGTNILGTNCEGGQTDCTLDGDVIGKILAYSSNSPYSALPSNWNWEDPNAQQYAPTGTAGGGKPGLQAYFENQRGLQCGTVINQTNAPGAGWLIFLNYYFWMQSSVDYQIGQVLGTNPGSTKGLMQNKTFWGNTVIIFTSDHGDYGGSHNLHSKGGALYDEVMQVPLYISFPAQRATPGVNTSHSLPYVCSAVDILPFLYSLALGNDSWRTNSNDMIYYLSNREAIQDAIYEYKSNNGNGQPVQERRISAIRLSQPAVGGPDWMNYQPFVLHTADDYSSATAWGGSHPSHAIAFRTADPTNSYTNANGQTVYGGGKLGIYSYWYTCNNPDYNAPIVGLTTEPMEYEFYNYSQAAPGGLPVNPAELGNQAFNTNGSGAFTTEAQAYYNDFFNLESPAHGINIQDELYNLYAANAQVQAAIQLAYCRYICFLTENGEATNQYGQFTACGNCPTCPQT